MAKIYIDEKAYEVDPSQNLLEVSLSLGFNLPYFCWHPALGSVGACRQCAVVQFKDEKDTQGRLVMACITPAADGTRISIENSQARTFRTGIIEWLMVNHPHDCPVCDEGGECHLQDMTVMTGHAYRSFRFKKRTFRNQDLGPFINHEMNRCITCYRCVRFYRDYAGGRDLHALGAHDHVYFGRHEDGVLENEFSGNLAEVCPTGVFTDKTCKRHYTRNWDFQNAPSICVHCGAGCNTIAGERYGELRRIRNRYNHEVNGYFICDRGRFGYEFVNQPERILEPLSRAGGKGRQQQTTREELLRRLAPLFGEGKSWIGIGSPRASLEANFALRSLVGKENFFNGLSDHHSRLLETMVEILKRGAVHPASLREAEHSDAVFVLGEDLTNVSPRLALALRQAVRQGPITKIAEPLKIPRWNDAAVREAVQQAKGPLFSATSYATKLDELATETYYATPAEIARLGFAVAHGIDSAAPAVPDLSADVKRLAGDIAGSLAEADRPLVVAGPSLGSEAILQAAANVALALGNRGKKVKLVCTALECNSVGATLIDSRGVDAALARVEEGHTTGMLILENDLYRRADAERVSHALAAVSHVIAIDALEHRTTLASEFVLPAATFAESSGTLVNEEGRAQRFYSVYSPPAGVQESWRWLGDLAVAGGHSESPPWENLDSVIASLVASLPALAKIGEVVPPASFRLAGQKIAREPHRYSGRTAKSAHRDVHEPKPADDPDSPLAYSMEGYDGHPPSALTPFFWAPGWNSPQSVAKFQSEVGGELRGGSPGARLFEAREGATLAFYDEIPGMVRAAEGEWLVVPIYHIFGSDELSAFSPPVASRAPASYLALSPESRKEFGLETDGTVELVLDGATYELPLRSMRGLPRGVAGLPVLAPFAGLELPVRGRLRKKQ